MSTTIRVGHLNGAYHSLVNCPLAFFYLSVRANRCCSPKAQCNRSLCSASTSVQRMHGLSSGPNLEPIALASQAPSRARTPVTSQPVTAEGERPPPAPRTRRARYLRHRFIGPRNARDDDDDKSLPLLFLFLRVLPRGRRVLLRCCPAAEDVRRKGARYK